MTYVNARTAVRTRTWMRAWELGEARSQLFRWNEFCSGHVSRVLTFAMKLLPFLNAVEGRFSPESSLKWMDKYWTVSLYIAVFYVVLVLAGRYWMRDRPAYGFRRALLAWNVGLAVFSTISAVTIFPSQLDIMLREGVGRGVCWSLGYTDPKIGLWTFLFILSKVAELGDTAFIVLRKSPFDGFARIPPRQCSRLLLVHVHNKTRLPCVVHDTEQYRPFRHVLLLCCKSVWVSSTFQDISMRYISTTGTIRYCN